MMHNTSKELEAGNYDNQVSPTFKGERKSIVGASIPHLLMISMPRMAIRMAWTAQWSALGPYVGTMMPKYAVKLAQIIGPVTGILVAPIVGAFSDHSTSKWGRRRPFLLYGAVASAICWTAMGYTRQIGDALGDYGTGKKGKPTDRTWTVFFTIFFYVWMDITVNVVQTPLNLLVADFAGERQTLGAALGQGCYHGSVRLGCRLHQSGEPREKLEQQSDSAMVFVKKAFGSIYIGFKTLPGELLKYCIVLFCVMYGYTAYNGNKRQFFGIEVYGESAEGANIYKPVCTEAQDAYNHDVNVAGGYTDLIFCLLGYVYSWALPWLVKRFGAMRVLVGSLVPLSLLMLMAYSSNVELNAGIVIFTAVSLTTTMALNVPVIVHVVGGNADIVILVGRPIASASYSTFSIGAGIVGTSMGYKLHVFLGGVMSLVGMVFTILFFKIRLYYM
ncbi:Glycoside-Pentoside-Hexuronide (GPH):Cation Symporter Family [Phytophthora cinnamomi]|uniref:Glycoside-Pentoside-Hexuronide (GPH):Cation Symporter Family n=1 Tax=Phytophthora cinnamomi TaxID=4785 RepID=UPI00355957B6|nr:Glycoside-Pentoside-Hexuronide (GPH):Cation Symporter Family [Phytophthora cinnamomi]